MSQPVKVLVVDDEHDVAVLFKQMFRRETRSGQMHLDFAFSGEEALSYLAEHRADVVLVLSDINMPGMTGLDLLKEIKSTPPPLPVCMMTAYGNEEYRTKADDFGCDGYLTKPIDFASLKQQIQTYLAEA